jgi:hypothetical protein
MMVNHPHDCPVCDEGGHCVTRIAVQPRISLKSENDLEAAREAIKDAAESCMISNSILATGTADNPPDPKNRLVRGKRKTQIAN